MQQQSNQERFPGARIGPDVIIGPGADIGPGVIIGPGAHIGPYVIIWPGARIGPCARIGPGVSLGPGARIGSGAIIESYKGKYQWNKYTDIASKIPVEMLRYGCVTLPLEIFRINLVQLCEAHDTSALDELTRILAD